MFKIPMNLHDVQILLAAEPFQFRFGPGILNKTIGDFSAGLVAATGVENKKKSGEM
jgi:hypothetical protein